MELGFIHVTEIETLGSTLTADADASTLTIEDSIDFSEDGGRAQIVGDGVSEIVTYEPFSTFDTTLSLAAPLTNSYVEGDEVLVYPADSTMYASVEQDEDGEIVVARVTHSLRDRIPVGIREPDERERVNIFHDGYEWIVTDLPHKVPVIDGTLIDPETLPPAQVGDGLIPDTPAAAPLVTRPAPGVLLVDMRAYDRPEDWQAFVPEVATFDDDTELWNAWTSLGASGELVPFQTDDYETLYRFRFAVNDIEDKVSGYSPETEGFSSRRVNEDGVDIEVDSITGEMFSAVVILSTLFATGTTGARVEHDADGIRLYNDEDTIIAWLPTTGQNPYFRATVEALGLDITGPANFRSGSKIAAGASLELESAVSDPVVEPIVERTWDKTDWSSLDGNSHPVRGDFHHYSEGYMNVERVYNGRVYVEYLHDPETTFVYFDDVGNNFRPEGICTDPTEADAFLLVTDENNHPHIQRRTIALNLPQTQSSNILDETFGPNRHSWERAYGITYDTFRDLIVVSYIKFYNDEFGGAWYAEIALFDPTTLATTGKGTKLAWLGSPSASPAKPVGVHYHAPDDIYYMLIESTSTSQPFDAPKVMSFDAGFLYPQDDPNYDGTLEFYTPQSDKPCGICHTGTEFQTIHFDGSLDDNRVNRRSYTDLLLPGVDSNAFFHAGYSWKSAAGSESRMSSNGFVRYPNRSKIRVTFPDLPPDVDTAQVWATFEALSAGIPDYNDFHRQVEVSTNEAFLESFSTADPSDPLAVTTFLDANPSELRGQNGLALRGDGRLALGDFTSDPAQALGGGEMIWRSDVGRLRWWNDTQTRWESPVVAMDAVDAFINSNESRNNVSYGNLATSGPDVWIKAPISGRALISVSCDIKTASGSAGNSGFASYEVAHWTTGDSSGSQDSEGIVQAAADNLAAKTATTVFVGSSRTNILTGLTPGNWYRVHAQYRRNGSGACDFRDRQLVVVPL